MPYRAEKLGEYAWLDKEPAPKMLRAALDLYGVKESIGERDNPIILDWAAECDLHDYKHDAIPWCGLFVAVVAKRSGKPLPAAPLWARDWAKWGDHSKPELGCVLVFVRAGGGHVGLYVGEDDDCYHVLGGNQSDCVCVMRIAKNRLLASRAMYRVKPSNVRAIHLDIMGEVSRNES